ncbi:MAG TPA: transcription termination/antitermination NusG family protein, partial [Pseudonocardiaceae bacterium]|nr:transcription termination/antitermination NusG family protein [Pseudonocardiaceae bacterium]
MTFPGGSFAGGTSTGGSSAGETSAGGTSTDEASTDNRQELTGLFDADTADTTDADTPEVDTPDVEPLDVIETADEPDQPAPAAEVEPADPVDELRSALATAPGEWYVVHSYAGYENKVKANLETRIQTLDVEDYIFQVEVPTEEVTEIKNGQRKQVQRKVLPGYILVRMELNDASWSAVRNTPGVTGFVGATSRPSPLTLDEVLKFLAPRVAQPKVPVGAGK